MKRGANSPMDSEKKKVSPSNEECAPLSSSPPTAHGMISYAEAAKSPGRGSESRKRRTTVSTLPVPEEGHLATTEGAIRNNFTVDILKRNGEDYKGTMKRTEAFISIFIGALGFNKEEFDGQFLVSRETQPSCSRQKASLTSTNDLPNLQHSATRKK
jgi:hypothetical protein